MPREGEKTFYNLSRFFFFFSAMICLLGWLVISVFVVHARNGVLPELDDSYGYLVKASEMKECFFQECQSLVDLQDQVIVPPENDSLDFYRSRVLHRLFSVYHPLHSFLLLSLQSMGLTWEGCYWVLFFSGKIFLVCAIAFWLYSLVGAVNAGGALLLLTLSSFSGHGLLYIVPSNLSLGIAMLLWGILAGNPFSQQKRCLVLVGLMEAMHPVGRLYAAAGLFALFLSSRKKEILSNVPFLFVYTFLLLFPFVLPFFIHKPFVGIITESPPDGWTLITGLYNESIQAGRILNYWLNNGAPFGLKSVAKYLLAFLLALWGWWCLPTERKKNTLSILAALLCLLSLQFIRMNPHYPGVLFSRVVVPLAILFYALWVSALVKVINDSFSSIVSEGGILKIKVNSLLLLIFLVLFIASHQYYQLLRSYSSVSLMVNRHLIKPDIEQVEYVKGMLSGNKISRLFYDSEIPLYIYLTHGLWNHGAVMNSVVLGSDIEKDWMSTKLSKASYLISRSPLFRLKTLGYLNGIRLKPGEFVDLVPLNANFDFNALHVETGSDLTGLSINCIDDEGRLIPDGILLEADGAISQSFESLQKTKGVRLENRDSKIKQIQGIKITGQSEAGLHWPWNSGITIQSCYSDSKGKRYSTVFSAQDLDRFGWRATALHDSGATVVFALSN